MTATGTGILPSYQRFANGAPIAFARKSFRSREKCVVVLVFLTFGFVCFGTFFFLPDFRAGLSSTDSVYRVYDQIKRAGPEFLLPPPPPMDESPRGLGLVRHNRDSQMDLDPHVLDDREKLRAKIESDGDLKVLERPDVRRSNSQEIKGRGIREDQIGDVLLQGFTNSPYIIRGGEDSDRTARERRNKVKELSFEVKSKGNNIHLMMKHAWDNYVRYAWGKNELKPVTKRGHGASIFGSMPIGATILDGLDTLYIMGMNEEFKQGRDWVANELDLDVMTSDVSVFEVNIRFVGGLLACYALTGDPIFKMKAQQIADKLLPAFETPTGIPHALVNFRTGGSKNYGWASGGSSILSEFGTLHLEFAYLSDVTGKSDYRNKVDHIRQFLMQKDKPKGLYPNYLNPKTGNWGQHHMSMGALGDSFYEYLLKAWIQSNKEDNEARQMYDDAMAAITQHMLFTSKNGLSYFAELKFDRPEHKMDHLGCFSGGLLGLGAQTLKNEVSNKYMDIAKKITETCHESYDRSTTKLGPESFRFTDGIEAKALKSSEKYYILRPEVVESYFYMYRFTKDQKYRDWGWEMVQALEKYCRVEGGYTGIKNVYTYDPLQDDVQQSFFLAETLKYLYLLFSDDSLLPLNEWVLNTEAHPLPIKGVNNFYREAV